MAASSDLARELLGLAGDDEAAARAMLPVGSVTDAIVGFHAQQAVEKALEAVLASQSIEFRFIHDLDYLNELCEENNIKLPPELEGATRLTSFAAIGRYGSQEPVRLDRDQALRWATSAVEWARQQIEPDEHSKEEDKA